MIEPVLGARPAGLRSGYPNGLRKRQDQFLLSGAQVHAPDAGVLGRQNVFVGIGQAGVAVTGPRIVETAEVRRNSPARVGRQGVNGRRQRALLPGLHIQDVGDKAIPRTVVPDHFGGRTRQPLEHRALLPVPGAAFAQLKPAVAVLEVHHADPNRVAGFGRAVLEVHLHAQSVTTGRIQLELVVVTEPVKFGAARDGPHGWKLSLAGAGQPGNEPDQGFEKCAPVRGHRWDSGVSKSNSL